MERDIDLINHGKFMSLSEEMSMNQRYAEVATTDNQSTLTGMLGRET